MSPKKLWVLTVILIVGSLFITFVLMPSRKTELEARGKRGYGTIQNLDSRPIADGKSLYFVTFLFKDDHERNHQVTVQMLDEGKYNSLKLNQDVKDVYYIPGQEDQASIPGAERMVAPHSSAVAFIAWSLFLAGCVTGVMAFLGANAAANPDRDDEDLPPSGESPDQPTKPARPARPKTKVTITRR